MNNPYNFFDQIVCVNLKNRKDKRIHSQKVFNRLNIPVKFNLVSKSPHGGVYGCFESHINIINNAYLKGYKNILIFEDDVIPSKYYSGKIINQCVNFMNTNKDWDLFYFGFCWLGNSSKNINANINKGKLLCTHSYAINRGSMKKILNEAKYYINNPDKEYPLDHFYKDKFNIYYPKKNQFIQNKCLGTDNIYHLMNMNINKIMDTTSCIIHTRLQLDTFILNNKDTIKLILFILILILIIKYSVK